MTSYIFTTPQKINMELLSKIYAFPSSEFPDFQVLP